MKQPMCPICGQDLMSNEGKDSDGKVIEPQVSYWMHDPKNTHVDVQVFAHKECFDQAKLIKPDFHLPVQSFTKYPTSTIKGGVPTLKTTTQFNALKIL